MTPSLPSTRPLRTCTALCRSNACSQSEANGVVRSLTSWWPLQRRSWRPSCCITTPTSISSHRSPANSASGSYLLAVSPEPATPLPPDGHREYAPEGEHRAVVGRRVGLPHPRPVVGQEVRGLVGGQRGEHGAHARS